MPVRVSHNALTPSVDKNFPALFAWGGSKLFNAPSL